MNHHDVAPQSGVRRLGMKAPNILLNSIGKLFSDANELICLHPASLSIVNSLPAPTPLINVFRLTVLGVVPGLELLLDGNMLPCLHSLSGLVVPLFVAFARRTNQMKTLDTIDHLVITDQEDDNERSFSFKQWHIVLDALPCLRTLILQFHNPKCPPMALADLFITYIRRSSQIFLTLFSCGIDHCSDTDSKERFIMHLEGRIKIICSFAQIALIGQTRLDVWI